MYRYIIFYELLGFNRHPLSQSPSIGSVVKTNKINKFVMPAEPPPREKWQPDNATQTCMVCRVERFSMVSILIIISIIPYTVSEKIFKIHVNIHCALKISDHFLDSSTF